jgi:class 3 adenylate cyclase
MAISGNFHHLIQSTYQPRIFAYGVAVVLLGSKMFYTGFSVPTILFLFFLLAHPHLNYYLFGLLKNSARGARISLMVDAWLIGLMIVMAEFNALASVAFVSGLVMSTLMIAKPGYLLLNLGLLILSTSLSYLLLSPDVYVEGRLVTNLLSSALIVGFGGLVASLGFVETSDLESRRRATDREKNVLQGTFDRLRPYVSSQLVSSLESADTIATCRKRITVFFSDIEGFTSMMDNLPEATMTQILNDYLNEMAEVAIAYGGTVDKFIGDGVMILFGAPESKGAVQDAFRCVQMAIAMRSRLECLRDRWCSEAIPTDLHIRIGIHSGYSAVGNFGSKQRMDYTAIGGVVNLASRLEKAAGTDEILVSAETWALVERHILGEIRRPIRVKGIQGEIPVVAILDIKGSETEIASPGFQLINTGR